VYEPISTAAGDLSGRIDGWRDFEDRIRAAMAVAASHGGDLTFVDTDFMHWPLGQRSLMEAFHQWGLHSKHTHCRLLAANFDGFGRQHPLWVAWRATWAHRVTCFEAPEELASSLKPVLVLHGQLGLRLHDSAHGSGVWTRDPGELTEWLSEIDVILQRSTPALPATTLGL
jgi:hypothetical protein